MEWAANLVSRGEITRNELPDGAFGIPGLVQIEISGDESDEFWNAFNDGY
jgi:hypothetical protein